MAPKKRPIQERFWEKVDKSEGCWEWTAGRFHSGYGRFTMGRGKSAELAHRLSYEFAYGDIPKGLEIDHLCRNRGCVNPKHLEAVTSRVNTLRGESIPAKNARKTHCKWGHAFDTENTIIQKDGRRRCRKCMKVNNDRRIRENGQVVGRHPRISD